MYLLDCDSKISREYIQIIVASNNLPSIRESHVIMQVFWHGIHSVAMHGSTICGCTSYIIYVVPGLDRIALASLLGSTDVLAAVRGNCAQTRLLDGKVRFRLNSTETCYPSPSCRCRLLLRVSSSRALVKVRMLPSP